MNESAARETASKIGRDENTFVLKFDVTREEDWREVVSEVGGNTSFFKTSLQVYI